MWRCHAHKHFLPQFSTMAPLQPKEAQIFKHILNFYETKQYKKGLKQCEVILKKIPEHGETLAMKGLLYNCLGRKEEGYTFVRLGLRHDLKSHVCWHVYGLLYRSDKNYEEAIKCYRNALRIDKENIQIIRDLSLLQMQTRDLEGFRETRQQLVTMRSAQRVNWIGLALSYHLLDSHETAIQVIAAYEESLKQGRSDYSPTENYDKSELLMYKVQLYVEMGNYQGALDSLEACRKDVVDLLAWREARADVLAKLGMSWEAEEILRGLIKTNSDCKQYYLSLEALLPSDSLPAVYENFRKQFPRAHFPKRRILDITTGDDFRKHLDGYLQTMIRKGTYTMFSTLKALYLDPVKTAVMGELVEGYLKEYLVSGKLSAAEDAPAEAPTARLWLEYFLAQHYDKLRQLEKALDHVNVAISYTPTFIELYALKARIYRHGGDYQQAADLMNTARELDTADRFLNSKCVKYMLRADRVKEAEDTIGLFTREGVDQVDNLVDMQCMWFAQCSGNSFLRQNKIGQALKKFHQIDKHFTDIYDDQFDFHTYCLRKMTLRAYVRLLRLEDRLRGYKSFKKAAYGAIQCYLTIDDQPKPATSQGSVPKAESSEGLSEKELKKLRSKQRREQARKEAVKEDPAKATEEVVSKAKPVDTDPEGAQLAATNDPLGEAIKFLKGLEYCGDDVTTHLMGAQVSLRRKRYLLVAKALKQAKALEASNSALHYWICVLATAVSQDSAIHVVTKKVVESELSSLMDGKNVSDFNADFLSHHTTPIDVCQGAKALACVHPNKKAEAVDMLLSTSKNLADCSLEDAETIMITLRTHFNDDDKAKSFAAEARK
eukprot:Ihof_evm2s415 gene=Ihof_evmTU2s415